LHGCEYSIWEHDAIKLKGIWANSKQTYDWNTTTILRKEEISNMEYLYKVYVVDNKKNIIVDEVIVAKNEDEAKFDLRVDETIREKGLKLSDVTIITQNLGAVKVELEKA